MGINRKIKAVFLDRDGVLNPTWGKDVYNNPESPLRFEDFKLFPFVPQVIKIINDLGFKVFVVTNQPAIAKGKMTLTDLDKMHHLLMKKTMEAGGKIEKIYSCLHHPDSDQVVLTILLSDCQCRKPKPGMLLEAANQYHVDLESSWMIGDSWRDVEAGKKAGCQTILVSPTKENILRSKPHFVADNLLNAVKIIKSKI